MNFEEKIIKKIQNKKGRFSEEEIIQELLEELSESFNKSLIENATNVQVMGKINDLPIIERLNKFAFTNQGVEYINNLDHSSYINAENQLRRAVESTLENLRMAGFVTSFKISNEIGDGEVEYTSEYQNTFDFANDLKTAVLGCKNILKDSSKLNINNIKDKKPHFATYTLYFGLMNIFNDARHVQLVEESFDYKNLVYNLVYTSIKLLEKENNIKVDFETYRNYYGFQFTKVSEEDYYNFSKSELADVLKYNDIYLALEDFLDGVYTKEQENLFISKIISNVSYLEGIKIGEKYLYENEKQL